jgi:hypothetical protein
MPFFVLTAFACAVLLQLLFHLSAKSLCIRPFMHRLYYLVKETFLSLQDNLYSSFHPSEHLSHSLCWLLLLISTMLIRAPFRRLEGCSRKYAMIIIIDLTYWYLLIMGRHFAKHFTCFITTNITLPSPIKHEESEISFSSRTWRRS